MLRTTTVTPSRGPQAVCPGNGTEVARLAPAMSWRRKRLPQIAALVVT